MVGDSFVEDMVQVTAVEIVKLRIEAGDIVLVKLPPEFPPDQYQTFGAAISNFINKFGATTMLMDQNFMIEILRSENDFKEKVRAIVREVIAEVSEAP